MNIVNLSKFIADKNYLRIDSSLFYNNRDIFIVKTLSSVVVGNYFYNISEIYSIIFSIMLTLNLY